MENCNNNCKDCQRIKHRSASEKKKLQNRLNIILGQVKGIQKMIEDERYCADILIQISAVDKSLKSLGNCILKEHLRTCVVEEIRNDNLEIVDEISSLFEKIR